MRVTALYFLLLSGINFWLAACTSTANHQVEGFRYSICEPLNPTIIEKGAISKDKIIETLKNFDWRFYLLQMTTVEEEKELYYSPSIEFENKSNKQGITISAVGMPDQYQFYIFYKKPKKGAATGEKEAVIYLTEQTEADAVACLKALIAEDQVFLDKMFE